MTRTTIRPSPPARTTERPAKPAEITGGSFVSWAPSDVERARDRAARRGDLDTLHVRTTADDPRAAFVRSLRALGLNACADVMVAKAA